MQKMTLILAMSLLLSMGARAHDFPTDETVRYVLGCMAELGGQTDENLYTCVCRYDVISSKMTYEEYDGGNIFERYRKMPGKKGGMFRDSELGEEMADKLIAAREEASRECPTVKRIEARSTQ